MSRQDVGRRAVEFAAGDFIRVMEKGAQREQRLLSVAQRLRHEIGDALGAALKFGVDLGPFSALELQEGARRGGDTN